MTDLIKDFLFCLMDALFVRDVLVLDSIPRSSHSGYAIRFLKAYRIVIVCVCVCFHQTI